MVQGWRNEENMSDTLENLAIIKRLVVALAIVAALMAGLIIMGAIMIKGSLAFLLLLIIIGLGLPGCFIWYYAEMIEAEIFNKNLR